MTSYITFEVPIIADPDHMWFFEEELIGNMVYMGGVDWFAAHVDQQTLYDTFAIGGYDEIKRELTRISWMDVPAFVAAAHLAEDGLVAGAVHHAAHELGLSVCPEWQPAAYLPGQVLPPGIRIFQKWGPGNKVSYVQAVGSRLRGCSWSLDNGKPRHIHYRDNLI